MITYNDIVGNAFIEDGETDIAYYQVEKAYSGDTEIAEIAKDLIQELQKGYDAAELENVFFTMNIQRTIHRDEDE